MSKKLSKVIPLFAASGIFSMLLFMVIPPVFAATQNVTFQVNVKEVLSVSVTTPTTWASGNINTLLRNKVGISVTSNNVDGFTASMTTKTANTSLINNAKSTATIATLDNDYTSSAFPVNSWGYSFDDNDAGLSSSTYSPLVGSGGTPITIISNDESLGNNGATKTTSKDIFFGAKTDISKASGTYTGTVVINVVSGAISNANPVTPENPATPVATEANTSATTYANGRTVHTSVSSDGSTSTTDIIDGDARSIYENPAGVTEESNITSGSSVLTGVAIVASAAAVVGAGVFVMARRDKDDAEDY